MPLISFSSPSSQRASTNHAKKWELGGFILFYIGFGLLYLSILVTGLVLHGIVPLGFLIVIYSHHSVVPLASNNLGFRYLCHFSYLPLLPFDGILGTYPTLRN